jgi:hypothetical protein
MGTPNKKIIQRQMSLETKYILTGKKYIPVLDGGGCGCDNCGKLIANIATVKNEDGKSFNIGFDCLETFLINNGLLNGLGVEQYQIAKKLFPIVQRFAKDLQHQIDFNKEQQKNRIHPVMLIGFNFERPKPFKWTIPSKTEYVTWYYQFEEQKSATYYNTNKKFAVIVVENFDLFVETLRNIFPRHKFEIVEKS